MKSKLNIGSYLFIFLSIITLIFISGCKTNEDENNSNIQVSITEKKLLRSVCSDTVTEALSIKIRTILQNTSEVSGSIDDWKIDFYDEDVLLLMINKSNYEGYACADQAVDKSEEIVTTGHFNFYGFVQFALFSDTIPDKVTITLTIKDASGHTYQITNTY